MYSLILAGAEALIVIVGIALLYWWTNKQAEEANAAMPKHLTESDFMANMVKDGDATMKQSAINRTAQVGGVLPRDTTIELQFIIVYHATRVGISKQARFRSERRAFFADKNWKKYRSVIAGAEKEK